MSKSVVKTGPERIFEEIENIDDGAISELLVDLLNYEMRAKTKQEAGIHKTDRTWHTDIYTRSIQKCAKKRQSQEVE